MSTDLTAPMLEVLARALMRADGFDWKGTGRVIDADPRNVRAARWKAQAETILEVMAEPNDAMLRAGADAMVEARQIGEPDPVAARRVFRRMIQSATRRNSRA